MYRGWLYLVAVMDWFSRYVLSWEVSVTLESEFCVSALEQALSFGRPEIFNTDQGNQFTSIDFTKILLNASVQISMEGKGRVFDNIFSERLWRTVKVEEVYLRDYQTVVHPKKLVRLAIKELTLDFLIDKQELIRNKVLKAKGLCGSDTMDVSVKRQFKGKIFRFRKNSERLACNGETKSLGKFSPGKL